MSVKKKIKKKTPRVNVPANTIIDLDDPDFWETLFNDKGASYYWSAEMALNGEIPLQRVESRAEELSEDDAERPRRLMRGNIFVIEAERGIGASATIYRIVYDGRLSFSLMQVPADAVTTRPELEEAKKNGTLVKFSLTDKWEYSDTGAFTVYRRLGGSNGTIETVKPKRVVINPTRETMENDLGGLATQLINFIVDKEFAFDTLDESDDTIPI